jgi:hypothetical protein
VACFVSFAADAAFFWAANFAAPIADLKRPRSVGRRLNRPAAISAARRAAATFRQSAIALDAAARFGASVGKPTVARVQRPCCAHPAGSKHAAQIEMAAGWAGASSRAVARPARFPNQQRFCRRQEPASTQSRHDFLNWTGRRFPSTPRTVMVAGKDIGQSPNMQWPNVWQLFLFWQGLLQKSLKGCLPWGCRTRSQPLPSKHAAKCWHPLQRRKSLPSAVRPEHQSGGASGCSGARFGIMRGPHRPAATAGA